MMRFREDGVYDFTRIRAVNITGGMTPIRGPQITIDASTLVVSQIIVFVNTSFRPCTLQLNNDGTVNTVDVYLLQPGQITLQWNGNNLV
jgi:hypothetical protein